MIINLGAIMIQSARNLLTLLVLIWLTCLTTASAQVKDAEEERLYGIVVTRFDSSDKEAFYKANDEYRQYVQEKGYKEKYYNSWNNEIIYDINNDHFYQALKKTEELEAILQREDTKDYDHFVNYLKGVFYGTREDYDLCREYLMKALDQTEPEKNNGDQVAIYQMLANINIFNDKEEGYKWADKAIGISRNTYTLSGSLGVKAMVAFTHQDKTVFDECYDRIKTIKQQHPDDYYPTYETYIEMGRKALNGQYDEAIALTDSIQSESERLEFQAVIHHLKGDLQTENVTLKDLIRSKERRNHEISVLMVDDISHDLELNKERQERRRAYVIAGIIALVALSIITVLLAYFAWTRRQHLKVMKAQNKELERARDHAQESDRMKTAFIRNVSHQIRTPLNVVSGFSQILATQIDDLTEGERQDLAERIEHNSSFIANTLNHLITMSEAESIRVSDSDDPVNCQAFCEEIVRTFKPLNKNLQLEYTSSVGHDTTVKTNAKMLKGIILELLVNADKFAKEGKIILDSQMKDGHWILSVTDTGDGIPQENIDSIFGKFNKIDDFSEGLGIGLTFCKTIALRLGGDVAIDGTYHDGARFIVTIPQQAST